MKEYCNRIDKMINVDLKNAAEKVATLDPHGTTGVSSLMADSLTTSTRRLRTVHGSLRRARTAAVLTSNGSSVTSHSSGSRESTPLSDSSR